jgi:hypothetical protein
MTLNNVFPRLALCVLVVYYSIAELGRSGSYINALKIAIAIFIFALLGHLSMKKSERVE